jgi:uncharacterized protein (DUF952 family)
MNLILHITRQEDWQQAQGVGVYRGDTLVSEGFIHCSTPQQVIGVAHRFYLGQAGLVLLGINSDQVQAPIQYERTENDEFFPHIYGALNLDAVTQVWEFVPQADGTFRLPAAIALQS